MNLESFDGPLPAPENSAQVNRLRRAKAEQIARQAFKVLGFPVARAPKCIRITARRGHGGSGEFSMPKWAFDKHPAFTLYYAVHEACHCVPSGESSHGPAFHRNESQVMEAFGYRLLYAERGPYLRGIRELNSDTTVCDKWGRCMV